MTAGSSPRVVKAETDVGVRVERRLYLTEDGRRAVPEGDPEAATLLCAAGGEVPRAVAERYGLVLEPTPVPEVQAEEAEAAPEPKQRRAPANKARRPSADKAGG